MKLLLHHLSSTGNLLLRQLSSSSIQKLHHRLSFHRSYLLLCSAPPPSLLPPQLSPPLLISTAISSLSTAKPSFLRSACRRLLSPLSSATLLCLLSPPICRSSLRLCFKPPSPSSRHLLRAFSTSVTTRAAVSSCPEEPAAGDLAGICIRRLGLCSTRLQNQTRIRDPFDPRPTVQDPAQYQFRPSFQSDSGPICTLNQKLTKSKPEIGN